MPSITPTPNPCRNYTIVSWTGRVFSDPSNCDPESTGQASYSTSFGTYTFVLTPDPAVPGQCVVAGGYTMEQGAGLCPSENLSGDWGCSGVLTPAGVFAVGCSCATGMSVQGARGGAEGGTISGTWTFSLGSIDGSGTFLLN